MFERLQRLFTSRASPATVADVPMPMSAYGQEFSAAWDRTARLGLTPPPIRLQVQKDCIDAAKATAVIVEYFTEHSLPELTGQIMAIYNTLQPRLMQELGVPLYFTIGWFELNGTPRLQHGDERIQEYLTDKLAAWQRDSVVFHFWLTSPALEVFDATFALNLGWAKSAEDCARRVVYQSAHAAPGNPVYHPMLVGDDFLVQSGAALSW
jgi:hypothetical protein